MKRETPFTFLIQIIIAILVLLALRSVIMDFWKALAEAIDRATP